MRGVPAHVYTLIPECKTRRIAGPFLASRRQQRSDVAGRSPDKGRQPRLVREAPARPGGACSLWWLGDSRTVGRCFVRRREGGIRLYRFAPGPAALRLYLGVSFTQRPAGFVRRCSDTRLALSWLRHTGLPLANRSTVSKALPAAVRGNKVRAGRRSKGDIMAWVCIWYLLAGHSRTGAQDFRSWVREAGGGRAALRPADPVSPQAACSPFCSR